MNVRRGAVAVLSMGVVALAGCASTTDSAAPESSAKTPLGATLCKDTSRLDMCVYVNNQALFWQAPLGGAAPETIGVPWAKNTAARNDNLGCHPNPAWDGPAAVGNHYVAYYESCNAGIQQWYGYTAPAVLGPENDVGMYAYIPYDGSRSTTCNSTPYVKCDPSYDGDSWQENFYYTFTTIPVQLQVVNQVQNADGKQVSLQRLQAPTSNLFLQDPVVPDPAVVAFGATGYYGLYAGQTGSPTFSAIYGVQSPGGSLDGGKFIINTAIDPATGQATAQQSCKWVPGPSQDVAPTCSMDTSGGGGGGGAVIVTATLHGDTP